MGWVWHVRKREESIVEVNLMNKNTKTRRLKMQFDCTRNTAIPTDSEKFELQWE